MRQAVTILFIIVIVLVTTNYFGGVSKDRDNCRRGNITRSIINDSLYRDARFQEMAARAREAAGTPLDLRTAAGYRADWKAIHLVPVIDCNKAFSFIPWVSYSASSPKPINQDIVNKQVTLILNKQK